MSSLITLSLLVPAAIARASPARPVRSTEGLRKYSLGTAWCLHWHYGESAPWLGAEVPD